MRGLIVLLLVVLCQAGRKDNTVSAFKHTLIHAKYKIGPTNNLLAVLDMNHSRMVNFDGGTVYTQADANAMDVANRAYILSQFGLNFAVCANGICGLPEGTMYPFANGDDFLYRNVFDSLNAEVGEEDETFIFDVGNLVLMKGNGTFPGGVMAGTTYGNNDILSTTQYTYLKESQRGWPMRRKNIKIIKVFGEVPAIQIKNNQGYTEQYVKLLAVNENGLKGFATVVTAVGDYKLEDGTTVAYQQIHTLITFNKTKNNH